MCILVFFLRQKSMIAAQTVKTKMEKYIRI